MNLSSRFALRLTTFNSSQFTTLRGCLLTVLWLGVWLLAGPAEAQPTSPIWEKLLGGSNYDFGGPVIANPDGSLVVAGSTSSTDGDVTVNKGESDVWVVKLDKLGQILWQRTYGGRSSEGATGITKTADGGYVVVGATYSFDGDVTGKKGQNDWWVIRLDSQGNLIWQKTFGGNSYDEASSVIATLDGGFVVAGSTTSMDGDVIGSKGLRDCWVIKLDGQGNLIWQKVVGGSSLDYHSTVMAATDGGFLFTGITSSKDGDASGNHGGNDWWAFKLDKNGNLIWHKELGQTSQDFLYISVMTPDGNLLLAGTQSIIDPNTGNYIGSQNRLVKLDIQGNILWDKPLNINTDKSFTGTATSDGGLVVVTYNSNVSYGIAKIDAQGNLQWQSSIDGSIDHQPSGLATTSDGSLIITGFARENIPDSQIDLWVAKLSLVSTLPQLSVYHLDDGDNKPVNSNNRLRPYLQIANQGPAPVPYSELTIRYWLTVDDFAPLTNLQVYFAQIGVANVKMTYVPLNQPRQNALGYVEYSFLPGAGSLAPGTRSGPIQNGIGKVNWTPMDEANDYSYAAHSTYTQNKQITLYRQGALVWGIEPPLVPAQPKLKVYSVNPGEPITNSINVRLVVRNEGNIPINYKDLRMRYYFTADDSRPLSFTVIKADLGEEHIKGFFVKLMPPAPGADTYRDISFSGLDKMHPLSGTGLIQFRIIKPGSFTQTNDHSYSAEWAENPRIVLYLNGKPVWGSLNSPPSQTGGRLAAQAAEIPLDVVVLGNPVVGSEVMVEVRGAEGQPLGLQLTDLQGRLLSEQQLEMAGALEQPRLKLSAQPPGLLMLRVNTPGQTKTIKLIKAD